MDSFARGADRRSDSVGRQSHSQGGGQIVGHVEVGGVSASDGYGALLQNIIVARRKRYDFFPSNLFVDAAWDIMLHTAFVQEQQRRITVSALSAAVNVPDTTAARWIRLLVDQNILTYRSAPTDARIKYVELSPAAAAKLRTYLRQINDASAI